MLNVNYYINEYGKVSFVYDKYIVSEEELAFIRISTKQEETG